MRPTEGFTVAGSVTHRGLNLDPLRFRPVVSVTNMDTARSPAS